MLLSNPRLQLNYISGVMSQDYYGAGNYIFITLSSNNFNTFPKYLKA